MTRKSPGPVFQTIRAARDVERERITIGDDGRATIVVWDEYPHRLEAVQQMLCEFGADAQVIGEFSSIERLEASRNCVLALVGIDARLCADDAALNAIGGFKQKGFQVIAWADGARSWPLGAQCLPLLAGAVRLLDSTAADFIAELRRFTAQLTKRETTAHAEEQRLKATMNKLGIVGESQAMISTFRWILRVSVLSDLPVLISGETGTGKQILANAVYQLDPKRCSGPFVAVNCGAISPTLAESELFGHRRGAFTGADRDRKGLIRSAHEGILFLDEIGELQGELQTKLLRMLQEKRVLGVGEDRETAVDVRVIAATNRDLGKMVEEGKFRADLFHRLNVLSIRIPPLRDRPADIQPLVEYFIQSYRSLNSRTVSAGADFFHALKTLALPGNVRQLENLVRQAIFQKNDDDPLAVSDLPLEVWRELAAAKQSPSQDRGQPDTCEGGPASPTAPSVSQLRLGPLQRSLLSTSLAGVKDRADLISHAVEILQANGWSLSQSVNYCEKLLFEAALNASGGNQTRTARLLGITPRSVYNKYRKYNLTR